MDVGRGKQPTLIIMAHADPDHVQRLIAVCRDQQIVLHCDSKTPEPVFRRMTAGLPSRVIIAPRQDTRLASWSLVEAELSCISLALERTESDHVIVMSGADYPLTDPARLGAVLAAWTNTSWLWNVDMPFSPWDVPGFRDGGLWRLEHYFPTRRGQVIWLGSKPLFTPVRRRIPADLEARASTQWKVLCRHDAHKLLTVLERRPDLVAFGRSTFIPEESFIPSVLASRRLFGAEALRICHYSPWATNWPEEGGPHPRWFSETDISRLQQTMLAIGNSADAATAELPNGGVPIFGRKFTSRYEADLLDQIEAIVWASQPDWMPMGSGSDDHGE